jgi:hypothetical protein
MVLALVAAHSLQLIGQSITPGGEATTHATTSAEDRTASQQQWLVEIDAEFLVLLDPKRLPDVDAAQCPSREPTARTS